jgi:hypothetical protein
MVPGLRFVERLAQASPAASYEQCTGSLQHVLS